MGWKARAPLLAAALWWGSLTAIGGVAVPLLFKNAASPAVAGNLAAKLFSGQTWVSLGCGILLLASARTEDDTPSMDWANGALLFVISGMLLALLAEFGMAPRILARQDLAFWHTAGVAMNVVQWACALIVLLKVTARGHPRAGGDPGA